MEESHSFRTENGRLVVFSRYGPSDGHPVVFNYGTPGTRRISPRLQAAIERNGAQVVILDRPGYGESARFAGRRVVDVVGDVEKAVDLLGWDSFAVWGGSGGAPHALACAAVLGGRVERCASVVGPAPYAAEGLEWFRGMSPGNVEEFSRALEGEGAYRPLVQRLANAAVEAARAGEVTIPDEYELPEADRVALRARTKEPGHLDRVVASYLEGIDGWVDDCIAFTKPWGFDVEAIRVPVSVWYGPDDVLVPRDHAEWLLAHVPAAQRRPLPAGHMLEDDELDSIYRWLVSPVSAGQ